MVSTVWGLSGAVLFAAAPPKSVPTGVKPSVVTFCVVAGTLLMTGVIYMNGALRAWGGRKVGGRATVGELSEAIALSEIPIVSWFVLSAAVLTLMRFTCGNAMAVRDARPAPLWVYLMLGSGAALLVWSGVLMRYCILEVQGFNAAQGRRAFWIGIKRYLLILAAAAVVLPLASAAVSRILRLFRG